MPIPLHDLTTRTASLALRALAALALAGAVFADAPPVRFMLTFDDGPSLWSSAPTSHIRQQLKDNPYTPNIKAIFFVQTAHIDHGGSPAGQALMHEACQEGHLLAVHSGTPRGHIPHTKMPEAELVESLNAGKQAIAAQCGQDAGVVRPPDWEFNDSTLATYRQVGLGMVLTDLSANDGKIYGWNISLRRRSHLHHELELVAQARAEGKLPIDGDVIPVVATFHDTNTYTAAHMTEYLQILIEESAKVGLPLANPPFYTDSATLRHAAQVRANGPGFLCDGASRSVTLRERLFGDPSLMRKGCL
ncbi:MAG: polysaccharide deacetylase family protein [Burkholderiales bacterium]|nr:polysaccharide deacetylase family protein [Burkholderiales bacterium]